MNENTQNHQSFRARYKQFRGTKTYTVIQFTIFILLSLQLSYLSIFTGSMFMAYLFYIIGVTIYIGHMCNVIEYWNGYYTLAAVIFAIFTSPLTVVLIILRNGIQFT